MARVRQKQTTDQRRLVRHVAQEALPLDDGTVTTPVTVAMIQALIPLGLKAVEEDRPEANQIRREVAEAVERIVREPRVSRLSAPNGGTGEVLVQ